ncbi:MAG: monovalent cation/H(+) antiporter subunit G [Syntrophobacteraceae bacterium]|nr:monovalent cation/H(+) antiporter subunit G [Syntrophobacteraceae bacterium]
MDLIVIFLVVSGLVFFAGGTIGLLRFPDFYSRLHPAGKLDTTGTLLVILGLAIHQLTPLTLASVLTGLKLMLIVVFVFLASPTATHAIVDAGLRAGLEPWKKGEPRR